MFAYQSSQARACLSGQTVHVPSNIVGSWSKDTSLHPPTNDDEMKSRWLICFITILGSNVTWDTVCAGKAKLRMKRWLLEPPSTQVGIFATISMPLEKYKEVSFAYFFEGNWYTLANSSYLDPFIDNAPIISVRRQRKSLETGGKNENTFITRKSIYTILERHFSREGLNGTKCLLKTICENAELPLTRNGIIGDILHVILTPSSSKDENLPDEYYIAEKEGLSGDCEKYDNDCEKSLFDFITLDFL